MEEENNKSAAVSNKGDAWICCRCKITFILQQLKAYLWKRICDCV